MRRLALLVLLASGCTALRDFDWTFGDLAAAPEDQSANLIDLAVRDQAQLGDAGLDLGPDMTDSLRVGLVAYWPFENAGEDASGNGHTLVADPTYPTNNPTYPTGKLGKGLFPGLGTTYTCNNGVDCNALETTDHAALDFGQGDFTIAVWVQRVPSSGVDGTWGHYGICDNGQVILRARASTNMAAPDPAYPEIALVGSGAPAPSVADTGYDVRSTYSGQWLHVVAYRQGSTLGLRVNGGTPVTTTIPGPFVVGASGTYDYVGRNVDGYEWQGTMDELAQWNRALSTAEMDRLWNGGAGLTIP